jgi:hypothetical protein
MHEVGEDHPAVLALFHALDGGFGLVDDDDQAVRAQRAEEFLLAAVAGVQRADADAGVLGHRGDRRAGVGDEHRTGRFEYAPVVAGGFGLVFPLVQGHALGWPAWLFGMLAASVLALAGFAAYQVRRQRAGRTPLVEPSIFGHRAYRAGVLFSIW